MTPIFNTEIIRTNRQRAMSHFDAHSFLHDHVGDIMVDKLLDIRRDHEKGIILGSLGLSDMVKKAKDIHKINHILTTSDIGKPCIYTNFESLPLAPHSLNCALSFMHMHMINDLPGFLLQIRQALQPDGVFLGSMLGGETLFELKAALNHAEMTLYGSLSPHIHPVADKQQMGALMQRAGYALPAIDSDIITVSYTDIYALMRDIRGMGEGYALSTPPARTYSKRFFDLAEHYYRDHFADPKDPSRIKASFEVIYVLGWSPDSSQPKPLRRGSAEHSMLDALDTSGERGDH